MQIGIIGAGTVARSFAAKAIAASHSVIFSNSRGPESLNPLVSEFGPLASASSTAEVVENPIVLLAVPWPKVDATLSALPRWRGQILIDATNGFKDGTPRQGFAEFPEASSSEHVAALAPGARVVKAMNSMFMSNFSSEPVQGKFRRVVFVSGDSWDARDTIANLFEDFGFAPIVLGTLAKGGRAQALGGSIAGHDFFVPWPSPRSFPAFGGGA
jgi:predicted dinucleotide-binding enzyme